MEPWIIFLALLLPTFTLNLLAAGRDQMLFQTRPRLRTSVMLLLVAAGVVLLLELGLPVTWALAMVLPGPIGSLLGNWIGSGDWLVMRYRLSLWLHRG